MSQTAEDSNVKLRLIATIDQKKQIKKLSEQLKNQTRINQVYLIDNCNTCLKNTSVIY